MERESTGGKEKGRGRRAVVGSPAALDRCTGAELLLGDAKIQGGTRVRGCGSMQRWRCSCNFEEGAETSSTSAGLGPSITCLTGRSRGRQALLSTGHKLLPTKTKELIVEIQLLGEEIMNREQNILSLKEYLICMLSVGCPLLLKFYHHLVVLEIRDDILSSAAAKSPAPPVLYTPVPLDIQCLASAQHEHLLNRIVPFMRMN
ncbi:uncharacterized protein [Triticum aestivum]|uniref:uncharacterized protein n=1 Tax=Triticum aestivum TaxID=4565 RepID=UPI001D00691E|nr:uncharacterized protein LOC123165888 [Triticum aestivum]